MNLPPDVERYRTTWVFTEATVPTGLLKAHRTKAGVWGRIVVLEGRLAYRVRGEETVLGPERPGVVEPGVVHEIEPLGIVRFFLEFYRESAPARVL